MAYPGVDVRSSYAGSQTLRIQIENGAAADVFASADPAHVASLESAGLVRGARPFAYNELALIVPRDNPAGIGSFWDLPRAERIVIGAETVPIGRYTRELLARASARASVPAAEGNGLAAARVSASFDQAVMSHVVSQEANVRQVRAKVELGEADAAIVYKTDAVSSARVRIVPIPEELNVRAEYVVAVLTRAAHARRAEDWVAYLLSDQGRAALGRHGFTTR
jgi:molybdate transport system substrate-binding protein